MANWNSFVIQLPGKELLKPVRNVLETLLIFLDILKAILDTIKIFLIDFGNPIKVLVETLIRLIEELFLSLKTTGISAYFDVPDPMQDPNFNKVSGGFQAFTERFKGSLFDPLDFNRPQPRQGSTQSGFVLLVVDAEGPYALIHRITQLLRFFGREFLSPRYEPPGNLRALPVGAKGDPILAVTKVFTDGPIDAVQLQWALPTSLETPDPGYSDVVTKVAKELIPPSFLIERSTSNPAAQKIDISQLQDPDATGTVEVNRATWTSTTNPSSPVMVRELLRDQYGDPVVKFQQYKLISQTDITSILGQLGKFRFIDDDVEEDKVYYYRVRAYSGTLKMAGGQPAFPTYDQLTFTIESNSSVMKWPGADEGLVMGKASGIISVSVPKRMDPAQFDVIENLTRLLQTAFSLDFHLAADPTGPAATQTGKGSLMNLASAIAAFESYLVIGDLSRANTINESFQPDPITGQVPQLPWVNSSVRKQARRLANAIASALLQAGFDALSGFRNIMQGSLPAGPIATPGLAGANTLEAVVKAFTPTENVTSKAATTFVSGYSDETLRSNVSSAIQYIKSYTLGGAPVDWISVVPLRDIVPWSGQMIYDLLAKIQALVDAYQGVMAEIKAFIDLIERKIDALERFIEFLINILNFIESLQIGAYVLSVPELTGNIQSWVTAIDTAGGTKPPSGPGSYTAGIGLGYAAPNITAFKTAFSIIFG
jgi:hypothetical protein